MNIAYLNQAQVSGKKVLLRADLDVPIVNGAITEKWRLDLLVPTISYLLDHGATQILIVGHMGRPVEVEGEHDMSLSLRPLEQFFKETITPETCFIEHQPFNVYYQVQEEIFKCNKKLILLENLRFWHQEEAADPSFAQQLAYGMDLFVNDAFASSHRPHASIVGIPNYLPSFVGLQFEKEIQNLNKIFENPKRPVIGIINGIKKDKLDYVEAFKEFCDKVLIAGRLPDYLPDDHSGHADPKLLIARLNPDKEDITIHSIEKFEQEISLAGTIILSGPVGKYEDTGHKLGTERVYIAVSRSNAFKIAGGGDTIAAINSFGIAKSFNWISAGGGAMLEFLAHKTLPGLQALVSK